MAEHDNPTGDQTNYDTPNYGTIIAGIILIAIVLFGFYACGSQGGHKDGSVQESTALTLCKKTAQQKAPYGFKSSTSDTTISKSNGKVVVTFENAQVGTALGATRMQTVQCDVTGTDESPTVDSFGAID